MTTHLPTHLPYARQSIDQVDIDAVVNVLRSDFLTTGPAVARFEEAFADYVGCRHAVACANGTAALHIAALALGLGPGDQAIVPSMTFVATANAIGYAGAEVIFSDVDENTGLITPELLSEAISRCDIKRLKAVLPVHLAGNVCEMNGLADVLAKKAPHVKIIEDACHAVGGDEQPGSRDTARVGACTWSKAAIFSLHPAKTITMGEGGVVCTNDTAFAKQVERLRQHGLVRDPDQFQPGGSGFDEATGAPNPWYYEMQELGFNYRATDIQCALGLSQLSKLDGFVEQRAALVKAYDAALGKLDCGISVMGGDREERTAWHLYAAQIDFSRQSRAEVMIALQQHGIGTQVHYIPVHQQPYYRALLQNLELPGADAYYRHTLSLPLYPALGQSDVSRVAGSLAEVLG